MNFQKTALRDLCGSDELEPDNDQPEVHIAMIPVRHKTLEIHQQMVQFHEPGKPNASDLHSFAQFRICGLDVSRRLVPVPARSRPDPRRQ